jgi:hypothetical protein
MVAVQRGGNMKRKMYFCILAMIICLTKLSAIAPAQLRVSSISTNPKKVTLKPGGNSVSVEMTGIGLSNVYYAVVIKSGIETPMIPVKVDRSQLPLLKLWFQASSTAAVANDYQLRILTSTKTKIIDLPASILAIECASATPKSSNQGRPAAAGAAFESGAQSGAAVPQPANVPQGAK